MSSVSARSISGYLRSDGRKGIRNYLLVVYLVECAHHVAREITLPYRERDVQIAGFGGCYPNKYAAAMLERICTHPNCGTVLLVSLGCEGFNRNALREAIASSGRPVETLVIQGSGGTRKTILEGQAWVRNALDQMDGVPRVSLGVEDLILGAVCGGSDATSGLASNPAIGRSLDTLVSDGTTAIFEEPGELLGCETAMCERARTPGVAEAIRGTMTKAERYYSKMGHNSISLGNMEGGLTTIEEKSMGSYAKTGNCEIVGVLKPGVVPTHPGMYMLDIVPDGEPRFGYPNINDNAEIAELAACGAHMILFSTGRGSVVGAAVTPVIKICGNPETYEMLQDDMDVNAGGLLRGEADLDEVGQAITDCVYAVAAGTATRSEALGHQEFVLNYKSFEPLGPGCLPA